MLTGGIVTLWRLRTRIFAALRDSLSIVGGSHPQVRAREDTDLSPKAIVSAVGLTVPVIFALCLMLGAGVALSAVISVYALSACTVPEYVTVVTLVGVVAFPTPVTSKPYLRRPRAVRSASPAMPTGSP